MMGGYLLDTCVISEATRPHASAKVSAWIRATLPERMFLSVANLAEIEQGIATLDQVRDGVKRVAGPLQRFDGVVERDQDIFRGKAEDGFDGGNTHCRLDQAGRWLRSGRCWCPRRCLSRSRSTGT